MAQTLFADTGYWAALANPSDELHDRAGNWYARVATARDAIVTSDWVLAETVQLVAIRAPRRRRALLAFVDAVRGDAAVQCVHVTRAIRERAWAGLCARPDQSWSWTDATSFVVMRERQLHLALAHDPHFREAGFEPLLRQEPPPAAR